MNNQHSRQSLEHGEKISQYCKEQLALRKNREILKRTMEIIDIDFNILHDGVKYNINVTPKGDGEYKIECHTEGKKAIIESHFSHTMSMNKAKELLIDFIIHFNRPQSLSQLSK